MAETLLGSGPLYSALHGMDVPPGVRVVATDTDAPELYTRVRAHGGSWLPVRAEPGWLLIGPVARAGEPGCPTCMCRRRDANLPHAKARRELRERPARDGGALRLLPVVGALAAALVSHELESGFACTAGALLRVSLTTGAITRHRVLADPMCPDCGPSPQAHPVRMRIEAAHKTDPGRFRVRDLQKNLHELYVDAETGLFGSVAVGAGGAVPWAAAWRGHPAEGDDSRHGYGRARDVRSARLTAITEALERHTSTIPRGQGTVRAAYADIAENALDPRTLGLYPDDRYDQPAFRFRRFTPQQEADWVWGHSFRTKQPILVPSTYAYSGTATQNDPGWAYECSNGAAVGGCLTEAVLYGLLEVAERDAFLLTWYARLPVPKVDLDSVADRWIPMTAAQILHRTGYEVMAFAMPMEQRVPAFWVLALNRQAGPGRAHALCGAGAHLDAEQALRGALVELLAALDNPVDLEEAARLLDDDDQVQQMEHHAALYAHPDAWPRLDFLPVDAPGRPLGELVEPWPRHQDLADDLTELTGRYLDTGLDVITVDTTGPELRAGGFAGAKVVVPGTASMTFGHRYRRTHDLPRLLRVPRLLGHRDRDLHLDELNPHPHPFP
ncbi:TOMM precursor leader peptide-binding protein [Streptomyces spiramyceticus]|uniref:TOMM precursor leader peptide-binding protein n=1 Tax=Streptomyces spiramyceticus TaxID=299717 RepID=UPI00237A1617|nr:TOMM precursor leader peptide-binding protein [Streptomyces spiramyceticus]